MSNAIDKPFGNGISKHRSHRIGGFVRFYFLNKLRDWLHLSVFITIHRRRIVIMPLETLVNYALPYCIVYTIMIHSLGCNFLMQFTCCWIDISNPAMILKRVMPLSNMHHCIHSQISKHNKCCRPWFHQPRIRALEKNSDQSSILWSKAPTHRISI